MTERISLTAGAVRAEVLPGMGGALAGLWVDGRPVLRPWSGREEDGAFAVANIVLAPFSNRISRPFDWEGGPVALAPNLAGEPFPIHGDAFQRRFEVDGCAPDQVGLSLADGAFGPLRYRLRLSYALAPGGLTATLVLASRAEGPMPFGLGFHPWFPRDADTGLRFAATAVWHEDARYLPAGTAPEPIPSEWDFSAGRALPGGWINNGFHGWDGQALVTQGEAAVTAGIRASANLDTLIVHSPGAGADFLCVEPVSHPVDAHNLPGRPGLRTLAPGETLTAWMELRWDAPAGPGRSSP